jgi:hypothetical protein
MIDTLEGSERLREGAREIRTLSWATYSAKTSEASFDAKAKEGAKNP